MTFATPSRPADYWWDRLSKTDNGRGTEWQKHLLGTAFARNGR